MVGVSSVDPTPSLIYPIPPYLVLKHLRPTFLLPSWHHFPPLHHLAEYSLLPAATGQYAASAGELTASAARSSVVANIF